jgi:hypothetical protein
MTATLPDHGAVIEAVLEGFVQAACIIVQAGVVPPYPDAMPNIRYSEEPAGSEEWWLPNQVVEAGWGDCEDLAIWCAAGDRVTGNDPGSRAVLVQTGVGRLHCMVQHSDGRYEDVALRIKRAGDARAAQRRVAGWGLGGEVRIRDHRTGDTSQTTGPRAAVTPGEGPGLTALDKALNKASKYMADHGLKELVIDTGYQPGDKYGAAEGSPLATIRSTGEYGDATNAFRDMHEAHAEVGPRQLDAYQRALASSQAAGEEIAPILRADFGRGVRTNGPPPDWVFDDQQGKYVPPSTAYDPSMYDQSGQYDPYASPYYYGDIPDMYSQSQASYAGWQYGDSQPITYEDIYGGFDDVDHQLDIVNAGDDDAMADDGALDVEAA